MVTVLADRLKLSDEQRVALASRFQSHQVAFDRFVAADYPDKEALEARLAELDPQTAEHDLLRIELEKLLAKSAQRQSGIDQALWSEARKLLNDDAQVAEWDRVMHERDRARFNRLMTLIPGFQVDVQQIASEMQWPQDVQDRIARIVDGYAVERDALLRHIVGEEVRYAREQGVKRSERNYRRQQAYRDLRDAGKPFEQSPIADEVTRDELRDQRDRLRTLKMMATLNQRFVESIASQLPDDLRQAFREAVQRASYPMVYWRDKQLDRTFGVVRMLEDLGDDQAAAIERLSASYELDLEQNQRAQIDAIDEHFSVRVGHPRKWAERVETSEAFRMLDEQRRAIDRRALDALLSLLTAEQQRLVGSRDLTQSVK